MSRVNAERLTNSDVHRVCGRGNNRSHNQTHLAHNSNLLSPKQIRQCANKRAEGGIGDEIADDEPHPPVDAADIVVNQGQDRAEEIQGNLRAYPEKRHAHQRHEELPVHLRKGVGFSLRFMEISRLTL
jgi:hypothetical protein